MMLSLAVLCAANVPASCVGQGICGITSVAPGVPLIYPPIARAAHVTGRVALMASFARDGSVSSLRTLYGPEMLRKTSEEYVAGWRVNAWGGSRECPVIVEFKLYEDVTCEAQRHAPVVTQLDSIHHEIVSDAYMICDPISRVQKRKRKFLFF